MESAEEQITVYALLVGEGGKWTLGDVSEATKRFSDMDLAYGMALSSRFGLAFQLAFGPEDMRTLQITGLAMPAMGTEIQNRGGDPFQINFDLVWTKWCEMLRQHGKESEGIPTHRIAELRHVCLQAKPLLSSDLSSVEVSRALDEAVEAISALLMARGFTGNAFTGRDSQA